jgi:hypothetical protein
LSNVKQPAGPLLGTLNDLAGWLGVSRQTVHDLQARGAIKRYPVGRVDLKEAVRSALDHYRREALRRVGVDPSLFL